MFERQWLVASGEWRGKTAYLGFLWVLLLATSHSPLATALDDPTQPADYLGTSLPVPQAGEAPSSDFTKGWVLSSTLISTTRRVAVINGKAVRQGDRVDEGVTVVDIKPSTVVLKNAQGVFSVTMLPATVKSPSGKKAAK